MCGYYYVYVCVCVYSGRTKLGRPDSSNREDLFLSFFLSFLPLESWSLGQRSFFLRENIKYIVGKRRERRRKRDKHPSVVVRFA